MHGCREQPLFMDDKSVGIVEYVRLLLNVLLSGRHKDSKWFFGVQRPLGSCRHRDTNSEIKL